MNNPRRSFVDEEDRVIDFFCSLTESEILMSELEANSLDEEKLKQLRQKIREKILNIQQQSQNNQTELTGSNKEMQTAKLVRKNSSTSSTQKDKEDQNSFQNKSHFTFARKQNITYKYETPVKKIKKKKRYNFDKFDKNYFSIRNPVRKPSFPSLDQFIYLNF